MSNLIEWPLTCVPPSPTRTPALKAHRQEEIWSSLQFPRGWPTGSLAHPIRETGVNNTGVWGWRLELPLRLWSLAEENLCGVTAAGAGAWEEGDREGPGSLFSGALWGGREMVENLRS